MSGAEAEFRVRFERAMRARHLKKGHNLNLINPKEIMLHKIIGEGSFGRVWSGKWRSSSVSGGMKHCVGDSVAVLGGCGGVKNEVSIACRVTENHVLCVYHSTVENSYWGEKLKIFFVLLEYIFF